MRKSTPPRILVDMDGVICNFVDAFMVVYLMNRGTVPDDFVWTDWHSMDRLPDQQARKAAWLDEALFRIPRPYEGAIKALEQLNNHYDVRIVTALPHMHIQTRSEWVEEHAPFIHRKDQMIFTNDKSLIRADMIIDDHLPNVYNWLYANKGTGVIIDRPWNQDEPPLTRLAGACLPVRVAELWEFVERIGLAWPEEDENAARKDGSVG